MLHPNYKSQAVLTFLVLMSLLFSRSIPVEAACTSPSPLPTGYASPCPVFSVSPASVSQSGSETLSASPQPGTDYIYTTAYYAKGTQWLPVTLIGNNAAPSYSTGVAQGSLTPTMLQTLPIGTNYIVLWDWLWDATAQCYKGPGLNQCNTGTWRIQSFTLTSNTYTYSQSAYTTGCTGCNNYYVSPTGSDSNPGTQASPWKTIQHAVNSNIPTPIGAGGTVIHVAAGTYSVAQMTTGADPLCGSSCSLFHLFIGKSGLSNTQRLVLQCDLQFQCLIRPSDTVVQEGIINVGLCCTVTNAGGTFVDVVGFDVAGTATGADSSHYTQAGIELSGNQSRALGNYVHHILIYRNNGGYGIVGNFGTTTTGCVDACPLNSLPANSYN